MSSLESPGIAFMDLIFNQHKLTVKQIEEGVEEIVKDCNLPDNAEAS